ncbi:MAG TPA: phosphate ABC transporter permease subunit PstC [Cellulomonadaceae bacterium]|nr:phosphate ABC transporter permease subunit PstC [Cellulomonadaceae bacterium]
MGSPHPDGGSTLLVPETARPEAPNPKPRPTRAKERLADRVFRRLTAGSAAFILVMLVAIAMFLLDRALPAIYQDSTSFFTTRTWLPDSTPPVFGIAALTYGTLVTSVLAVLMAVPVAVGVALSVTNYVPRRAAQVVGYLVDLLAAIPSVVYGLWGLIFLVPAIGPLSKWLADYFGWIPIFRSQGIFGKSIFTASVVLAIMILPIIAAISREVFTQAPQSQKEAAYALGATKWEMIRTAVLPYARSGLISATVLGFGRAMGETIAVALVLSANYEINLHVLAPGGNTIAANIANTYGDAGKVGQGALIASGLVLFVITLIVNFGARAIVARNKDFRVSAA